MAAIAHMARMEERQAIVDLLPKGHDPDKSESWNAGYDAAMVALIRIVVGRSQMH